MVAKLLRHPGPSNQAGPDSAIALSTCTYTQLLRRVCLPGLRRADCWLFQFPFLSSYPSLRPSSTPFLFFIILRSILVYQSLLSSFISIRSSFPALPPSFFISLVFFPPSRILPLHSSASEANIHFSYIPLPFPSPPAPPRRATIGPCEAKQTRQKSCFLQQDETGWQDRDSRARPSRAGETAARRMKDGDAGGGKRRNEG